MRRWAGRRYPSRLRRLSPSAVSTILWFALRTRSRSVYRSRRPRAISEDYSIRTHVWVAVLRHPHRRRQRGPDRHVQGALSHSAGTERASRGMHNQGRSPPSPPSTRSAVPNTAYTLLLDRHDAAKRPRKDRRAGVQDSAQPRVQVRPLELGTYAMCELIAPRRKTPVFVKSMECAVAVAQAFGKERCAIGSDC